MIEFIDTKGRGQTYKVMRVEVPLDREFTVREFCSLVLSERPDEFGEFIVNTDQGYYTRRYCHGEAIECAHHYLPRHVLNSIVKGTYADVSIISNRVDYRIMAKGDQ